MTLAGLAVTDFIPLFNTFGKDYGSIARGIAAKISIAKTWVEARMATQYGSKGFEWLSETTSPFFRKIDFYNSSTNTAISLKSVNAAENFEFKKIFCKI